MVEESAASIYQRTIIHVDQNAVLSSFDAFPHYQQKFRQLSSRGNAAFVADLEELQSWLNTLFMHYSALAERYELDRENVATLLLSLFSMLPSTERCHREEKYRLSGHVMLWVEENYSEKFSLENIAADLKKSKSYISRRFHAETGEKINEYLTTYRLRKACDLLLRSQLSVSEIANRVGFSDTTYFITVFKKASANPPCSIVSTIIHEQSGQYWPVCFSYMSDACRP